MHIVEDGQLAHLQRLRWIAWIVLLLVGCDNRSPVPFSAAPAQRLDAGFFGPDMFQTWSFTEPEVPGSWTGLSTSTFIMGAQRPDDYGDQYCLQFRTGVTTVTLTRRFAISSTEVTQGQFRMLMGYSPSKLSTCGDDCPVESVTWHEAAAYSNKLSELTGRALCYFCEGAGPSTTCKEELRYRGDGIYTCGGYRLPTEAEWEFAYRGGAETDFYSGNIEPELCRTSSCTPPSENLDKIAWWCGNSASTTHPVGLKQPNSWGLFDMSGNVKEWCNDWHDKLLHQSTSSIDPGGQPSGLFRTVRNGSFKVSAPRNMAESRGGETPESRHYDVGFRCARTLPE